MLIAWILSILFLKWTLQAPVGKKRKVKSIIRSIVFYSGVIWWMGRPEKEKDLEKRRVRMNKMRSQIRSVAIEFIFLSIVMISLGIWALIDAIYDIAIVFLFLLAPFVGLYSLYLFLLSHLLKSEENW